MQQSRVPVYFQVDSPAQLANELVNVTDNTEEIKREDISLTVGLLDTVAQSSEDLQQEDVSDNAKHIRSAVLSFILHGLKEAG